MDNSLFDKTFRDSQGNIVIAQPPNLPILAGITATILKYFNTDNSLYLVLDTLALGCLFTWAWQELFEGVNYFRRGIGLLALIGIIAARFSPYF